MVKIRIGANVYNNVGVCYDTVMFGIFDLAALYSVFVEALFFRSVFLLLLVVSVWCWLLECGYI
jgi:hypothetical protein